MTRELVIDGNNKIAGRLASFVAKELLKGNKVTVLNVEKIIISGKREAIVEEFRRRRDRGDPYKGPFYPRYPDEIFRRIVRGMLPYKKDRGREALKNLKVFYGIPEEYRDKIMDVKIKEAKDIIRTEYMSLEEIAIMLGAKKRW